MRERRERRKHSRSELYGKLFILWQENEGPEKYSKAECLEVSHYGLKMRVAERLPSRAHVMFNCYELGIAGRGTVRFCNPVRAFYEVGIECLGGTGWRDVLTRMQREILPDSGASKPFG